MPYQTITVSVPEETYEPFRRRAQQEQRSVEEAVLQAMLRALEADEHSAGERHAMVAALASLDTAALWQLVRRGAETEDVLLLAALNEKRQRNGLTTTEESVVRDLIRQHDRVVLLRAKALAQLRQRGEDVSTLLVEGER